jgi:hypothetical protein
MVFLEGETFFTDQQCLEVIMSSGRREWIEYAVDLQLYKHEGEGEI